MLLRVTFGLVLLMVLSASTQTINLQGIVSNRNEDPISGAIVTLMGQGIQDTTGADGAYSIKQSDMAVSSSFGSQYSKISINRDVLEFSLTTFSPVKLEILNVNGNLLKKQLLPNASPGRYRFNIKENSNWTGLLIIRISIEGRVTTVPFFPLYGGKYELNSSAESTLPAMGKLTKIAADIDSLKVTADGYETKIIGITSFDSEVNISLNASEEGGRSAGCGKTPTMTSGTRSIQSGGQNRSFKLSIPDEYDNNHPHRLVFAFHWNGGTMNDVDGGGSSGDAWSYYGLREQAGNSTIFVAPQGNGNGWANPGGQDLTFVDDMVEQIENDLCVDTERIFSMGFSYGGGMSYAIACARADVFRAVAVYSGMQLSGCEDGTKPIAYIGIHGISDGTCRIDAGRSLRNKFVSNNKCTSQNPPEPSGGSGTHICTTYEGCQDEYPVEWCAFDGGHTPGHVEGGGDDGARTWTKGEVWKFFTQF